MQHFLARAQEPSSYGGVGLIATGVSMLLDGAIAVGLLQILAGVAAVALSERRG